MPRKRSLWVMLVSLSLAMACSDAPSGGSEAPRQEPGASAAPPPARSASAEKETGEPASTPPPRTDPGALADEGRQVYLSSCIACHNADPTLDGALGPAIAGSSRELIEARVMRGEYPPGYTPKRDTRVMIAMPFLESKIPALEAYLASAR